MTPRRHAHPIERPSRVREAVDVICFLGAIVVIILVLSLADVRA